MDWLDGRFRDEKQILDQLLLAGKLLFDDSLRSNLPERPGLYAISVKGAPPGEFLGLHP